MADKKKNMVMVISVGGKPPKSPEDTSTPDVKKAPIPEAMAPMGGKSKNEGFQASPSGAAMLGNHPSLDKPEFMTQEEQRLRNRDRNPPSATELAQEADAEMVRDSHSNPVLPQPFGVDPPMPEVGEGDSMTMFPRAVARRDDSHRDKEFWSPDADEEKGGAFFSPESLRRLQSGQKPKPIMTSFDGPLEMAWRLLKFVNKEKYQNMVPDEKEKSPEEVSFSVDWDHLRELVDTAGLDPSILELQPKPRSPSRGLSQLPDPFRMKRPEMEEEWENIQDETARRGLNKIGPEYGLPKLSELGDEESPQFSMTEPEMADRFVAIQNELKRRGKPALGE